jgi:predicted aspartyl protease
VTGLPPDEQAPAFHATRALIDTGASGVCIDYRIAHALRLREVDQCTITVVGSSIPAAIFMADLEVPALGYHRTIPLIASKVGRINYNVLLGRSFLSDYIVTFDGPAGCFHFVEAPPHVHAPPEEDG